MITKWLKLHKRKEEDAVIQMGRGDIWLRAYTWDKGALGGEGCGVPGQGTAYRG